MTEMTRRTLLGGAAVAGVGALTAGALEGSAEAATLQGSLPTSVDVVVVGGGISGLVAARQVARSGRSVLVVEARDRVGGRVLNHRLGSGAVIESGGAFVGPTQDHIIALADELKVPIFEEYVDGKSVYNSSGPLGRQDYDGTVPPDPLILPDAAILQTQLDQWASEIDVDAPWTHPRAKEWDSMTLGHYVRGHAINRDGIEHLAQLLDPAGLRRRPRPALAAVRHLLRGVLRQRDAPGHLRAQLRHRQTAPRSGASSAVRSSSRCVSRASSVRGSRSTPRSPGSTRTARGPSYAPAAERSPASGSSSPCRLSCPAPSRGLRHLPARHRRPAEPHEHGRPDEVRRRLRRAVLARRTASTGSGSVTTAPSARRSTTARPTARPGVLLAFVGGSTWKQYGLATLDARRAGGAPGLRRDVRREGTAPGRVRRARLDQGAVDQGRARRDHEARHADSPTARRSAARTCAPTGPAPRPPRTGPATWTAPCAPVSGPPPRCCGSSSSQRHLVHRGTDPGPVRHLCAVPHQIDVYLWALES